jgi:hypothetical protein
MLIRDHARSPMPGRRRFHPHPGNVGVLAPAQFMHLAEAANEVSIAALHHDGSTRREPAKRTQVGVIHMCVGKQDEVERGQLTRMKGRLHKASGSHLGEATTDSYPRLQRRVCQHQ